MEETDKDWLMIRLMSGVSSGTSSLGWSRTKGCRTVVVVVVFISPPTSRSRHITKQISMFLGVQTQTQTKNFHFSMK